MTSAINPTNPTEGAATTASVRANFQAAKDEIEALQQARKYNVGDVFLHASTTPPSGTLECDGSLVSRTTYPDLFAEIGTIFGAGDGSSTFALPDLRAEFPRGWDHGRGVDTGRAFGSAQGSANLSHTHGSVTGSGGSHNHTYQNPGGGGGSYGWGAGYQVVENVNTSTAAAHTHSIAADGGSEARSRNIALLFCIQA